MTFEEGLTLLLKVQGVKVDAISNYSAKQVTPLYEAARRGNDKALDMLIAAGATE